MEILKVTGSTYAINTGMTYIPFYKINDEEIIMLDSGWHVGEREGIDEVIEKNNFKVKAIICSHAHRDHVGNSAHLKKKYNCTIAMSAYEAEVCSSIDNLMIYYGNQTLAEVEEHLGDMVCETDIRILDNQDEICFNDLKFKIFHTPGHSAAHICIITPDDVAYIGDALISYDLMEKSKMPYSFILNEDLKSKAKLYDLKCSKYVVAHKGIYDNITKLISDNIDLYKNTAVKIYGIIEGSMTLEDIMKAVSTNFNIHVKGMHRYALIERMLKSYIEYLQETEMMESIIEDGFLKYKKVTH